MRAIAISMVLLAACDADGALCDHDQRYLYGLCYEVSTTEDAGVDATYSHFGDPCTRNDECAAPTSFCAIELDHAQGYCTRTGCLDVAAACPATWTCLDLNVYQPGFSVCTQ